MDYSCTAGVYCCTRKFRAIKCEHLCDMRFPWQFPSPRDSSLNPDGLPEQVSLLRSTGPPHPSGYWRFYHTPRSTGVLYSSSWLQTWFKYSNMKLSFVSRPDGANTLILCISSLSPADKNYYKRWWSICHSTSGLKHPFTYWARRIAGRPAAAYDQMALLMTG